MGLTFASCAPSRAQVFSPVAETARTRTGFDVTWRSPMMGDQRIRNAVDQLLADGVTLKEAIRIGLLNNRRLQAAFDELGVARAALASASLVPNTEIAVQLRFPLSGGKDPDVEIDAVQNVLALITLNRERRIASAELEVARMDAIGAVVDLVAQVRQAYYAAQAAQQHLEMRQTIARVTGASYTLARRLHAAGNLTDLDLLRERGQYEQAKIDLVTAEAAVVPTRERLASILGLSGTTTKLTVPHRLPPVPADALDLSRLDHLAIQRSLELAAERWKLRAATGRVGLARLGRWLPQLGLGISAERDGGDGTWGLGPALVLKLPIWNRNTDQIARHESLRSQSQHRYAALAIEIAAEARAVRARLRGARARAEAYRTTLLPLGRELVEQTQRARNAMAASTFELLAAKRRLVEAGAAYVDALLEYWRARTAADQILAGRRPSTEEQR